jgi:uroporphyrinogen-III synthase
VEIACTRHIEKGNKSIALSRGIQLVDYPLVKTTYLSHPSLVSMLQKQSRNLVFTSKHALLALEQIAGLDLVPKDHVVYCISGRTQDYAEKLGFKVRGTATNSKLLAACIQKDRVKDVLHLTSNIRLADLQDVSASQNIKYTAVEVYHKEKQEYTWDNYDGIAFFSPSQIDAFLVCNTLQKEKPVFCIGHTTADYGIYKGFKRVLVSESPSEEDIVKKIMNYYTPIR